MWFFLSRQNRSQPTKQTCSCLPWACAFISSPSSSLRSAKGIGFPLAFSPQFSGRRTKFGSPLSWAGVQKVPPQCTLQTSISQLPSLHLSSGPGRRWRRRGPGCFGEGLGVCGVLVLCVGRARAPLGGSIIKIRVRVGKRLLGCAGRCLEVPLSRKLAWRLRFALLRPVWVGFGLGGRAGFRERGSCGFFFFWVPRGPSRRRRVRAGAGVVFSHRVPWGFGRVFAACYHCVFHSLVSLFSRRDIIACFSSALVTKLLVSPFFSLFSPGDVIAYRSVSVSALVTYLLVGCSPGDAIACSSSVGKSMALLLCFSSQVFAARNFFFLVMQATLTAFAVGAGAQRCLDWGRKPVSSGALHRRHVSCSHGHVSAHVVLGGLPVTATAESVSATSSTPWTAVSKSWGQIHQRCGDVSNRWSSRWPQSLNTLPCRRTSRAWQQNLRRGRRALHPGARRTRDRGGA